ncbi:MAG: dolichol kinase [Hyphomonadaceae bacterium BRH_c29]|nr:MAG: dolichol kinase [Hyphomonadaceae bacterium BRH_c29]
MATQALNVTNPDFKTKNGISAADRKKIAEALGVVLADTYMLFIKTQGVHWNVTGPTFMGVHTLTEEQYENMYQAIDGLAERIRALGHKAPASYTKYGELSSIRDKDEVQTVQQMLDMLIADHETAVLNMRAATEWCEAKNDYVTADMLTARMSWHEQAVWMLKSMASN